MRVSESQFARKLLLMFFLVFSISIYAVGPNLPIRIEVSDKDPWMVSIFADEKLVEQLKIEVWLYQEGEILKKKEVAIDELKFNNSKKKQMQYASLSLQTDELKGMPEGVYAQKIIVEVARLEDKSTQPFRVQRWSYLQVDRSGIKPLTLESYSAIADPTVADIDYFGEETVIYVGKGAKSAIDLRETKLNAAMPLGRLGGLQPERVVKQEQQDKQQDERDED